MLSVGSEQKVMWISQLETRRNPKP